MYKKMSHTEYIVEAGSNTLSAYELGWATIGVIAFAASIYVYVIPYIRKKRELKTF